MNRDETIHMPNVQHVFKCFTVPRLLFIIICNTAAPTSANKIRTFCLTVKDIACSKELILIDKRQKLVGVG